MVPLAGVLALALLLAACAEQQGEGAAAPGEPAASPSPPPDRAAATPRPRPRPAAAPGLTPRPPAPPPAGGAPGKGTPPAGGQPLRLVGTVSAGVEPGCMLLGAAGRTWLLLGGDRSLLRPGRRVEVTGEPVANIMTTCQQGRPFRVRSARAL
ncbi:MAG TPA: hypothetical protein VKG45_09040 [Actinomycetes bacterium]|nr:hypothetical protein [Actinomycetes bacterium]